MIATNVGGIPEIYGPFRDRLGPPDDAENLRQRIERALETPADRLRRDASDLASYVAAHFSIQTMVDSVMAGYGEAIARRRRSRVEAPLAAAPSHH
jgi:glycosyltransferase involved in cell wall biosynthesis